MDRIAYIGNEPKVIELLSCIKDIDICAVICESKKKELFIESRSYTVTYYQCNKQTLTDVMNELYDVIDYAVMYSFGIIIPFEIIKHIDIYNFHPGDLRTNRGSSPINWSILNGDDTTKMSLHRIDERIDDGELISEHICRVYKTDVLGTLRARVEGEMPSMIL